MIPNARIITHFSFEKKSLKTKPKGITTSFLLNKHFNSKSYAFSRLPFAEDFPNDYKVVSRMGIRYMSNMVEIRLLRGLMMEHVLFVPLIKRICVLMIWRSSWTTWRGHWLWNTFHWRLWVRRMIKRSVLKQSWKRPWRSKRKTLIKSTKKLTHAKNKLLNNLLRRPFSLKRV